MAYSSTLGETDFATKDELKLISDIRAQVEPELAGLREAGLDFPHTTGDIFFTRLVRGNNGSVEESIKWYKDFLEIRKKYKLDEIYKSCEARNVKWVAIAMPHYELMSQFQNCLFDEENLLTVGGCPIWYDSVGDQDSKRMLEEVGEEKVKEFYHTAFEIRCSMADRLSREQGKIVKLVRIMDFKGTTLSQRNSTWDRFDKEHIRPVLVGTSIEVSHLVFLINFPSIFRQLYEFVKVFFPPRLVARFRVLDTDYLQNKEYLTTVGSTQSKQCTDTCKAGDQGDLDSREGTMVPILAGKVMERVISVNKGQKVSWNYRVGRADESGCAQRSMFSRLSTKFAGSEICFGVHALWTDLLEGDIVKVSCRARSAGTAHGDTCEFWVKEDKLDYEPKAGVNVIALDPKTLVPSLRKSYELAGNADADNQELIRDINELPEATMVLFAVKGTGAERLSEAGWEALRTCGAKLSAGHFGMGYSLVGVKGGAGIAELRGGDVTASGDVPTDPIESEVVKLREVSMDDGEQAGSMTVPRDGMVVVTWSNRHSYLSGKTVAEFKISVE